MKSVESPADIHCPYCKEILPPDQSQQCPSCGGDWDQFPEREAKARAQAERQFQLQRILNGFILLFLLLFPAYTLIKGGFGIIPLLLFLPVIAWFFIGIRPFLRK